MGRALLAPAIHVMPQTRRDLTFRGPKFTYRVQTLNGSGTYSVSDGDHSLSVPIEWTFGASAQTWLLNRNGNFLESMVSYYPEAKGLDITLGHQSIEPATLEEALGRPLAQDVVVACFGCHSAGSAANRKLTLNTLEPGVTCTRCHQNAAQHAASLMAKGGSKVIPENLGARTAESISNFCGQCHRTWETVVRNNWRGPANVRFQPYRLANSKCFDGADPRIACTACHNPHENLVHDEGSTYDSKCLSCHASTARACSVSQSRCVSCHMPKVQLPGGHQTFTDHNIRIVRANDPYPN